MIQRHSYLVLFITESLGRFDLKGNIKFFKRIYKINSTYPNRAVEKFVAQNNIFIEIRWISIPF